MSLGYDVDRLKRLCWGLFAGSSQTPATEATFTDRWDDVIGEILPGLTTSAPTVAAYRDTGFLAYHFVHNQDDELNFRFQLPHRWNRGETRLHVHFIPCVNPAAPEYVVWETLYCWAPYGVALPAATGWTTVEARHTVSTSAAFVPTVTPLATIAPHASADESDILCVRLRRLGSSAPATPGWTDTYTTSKTSPAGSATANVMLLSCDLHCQAEKIGTVEEHAG